MARTKRQVIKSIYKNIDTTGFYTDNWQKVRDIVKTIRDMGAEVIIQPTDNNLYSSGYPVDGSISCKNYSLTILVDDFKIYGNIHCAGAGSVEEPLSRYDISLSLF